MTMTNKFKPAEDYELERMDHELELVGTLAVALISVMLGVALLVVWL
jgi:hypothetical protein